MAGHVVHMGEMIHAYKILARKLEELTPSLQIWCATKSVSFSHTGEHKSHRNRTLPSGQCCVLHQCFVVNITDLQRSTL
jgi:hypothetical protein